ncbi:MAG: hypothetical protein JSW59_11540 [Phycisphaerales bacterium]|nr:MAG: hypothetical protein JSW59_11540 [Phycisphaerales bacterium]
MKRKAISSGLLVAGGPMLLCLLLAPSASGCKDRTAEVYIKLKKISALKVDRKPRDIAARPKVYSVHVGRDDPYIFDFSNQPEFMFALPARDHQVKLGQELVVKAVLTDPELDIMIRDLTVMTDACTTPGNFTAR